MNRMMPMRGRWRSMGLLSALVVTVSVGLPAQPPSTTGLDAHVVLHPKGKGRASSAASASGNATMERPAASLTTARVRKGARSVQLQAPAARGTARATAPAGTATARGSAAMTGRVDPPPPPRTARSKPGR